MYRFNIFTIQGFLSLLITQSSIFQNYSNLGQYVEDIVEILNLELALANALVMEK
jgi:hypothetical protein